ncbi:MAG TPA: hypothetical protein VMZ04_03380, partial [Anaerolineae bacterium]|nr:hypothetical protein [Anaerolineae bacterium]
IYNCNLLHPILIDQCPARKKWNTRPKQIDPTGRQHILDELAEYIGDCEFITDDDIKAVTFDSMCQFIEEKRAVRFITETGGIDHEPLYTNDH